MSRNTNWEALARSQATLRERLDRAFWTAVAVEGDCWLWTGALQSRNRWGTEPYGVLSRFGKRLYAHRYAYALVNGPIPTGMEVLHSCDRPRCINPAHLSVGTHAQNMAEMEQRGRSTRRLTQTQVNELRALHASGLSQYELGRRFGLSQSTVSEIARGELYRYEVAS